MKIIKKEKIGEAFGVRVVRFEVESAIIAQAARPGQFVALMVKEKGERIPLTVVKADKEKKTITLIVQEVGLTTKLLGQLEAGDKLYSLVGPLGKATKIKKYGKVILVGGGVGIAEIYPIAKALKEAGNKVFTILGARTKNLLILEKELNSISDQLYLATDDGSRQRKCFTTDILSELILQDAYDLIYAVGPIPMMQKVSLFAAKFKIKSLVSLNSLMVDASGMCGSCRVLVGGEVKFACVDGPEFPAGLVDWQSLGKRSKIYQEKENHICRLNNLPT